MKCIIINNYELIRGPGINFMLLKTNTFIESGDPACKYNLAWKQCADLPIELSSGITTIINGKVYCGGGVANDDNDEYNVYCYDPMLFWLIKTNTKIP